jgi:hypothetical protein
MRVSQKIIISALLAILAATGVAYLVVAMDEYSDYKELADMGIKGETAEKVFEVAFFVGSAAVYFGLCGLIYKSGKTRRFPHVMAIVVSVALILAYIASRTVGVPVVGIEYYVGKTDIVIKVLQIVVIGLSAFAIYNMKEKRVMTKVN